MGIPLAMLRALPRIPFSKKEHGKNTRECWSGIAHACDLRRTFLVETKASIALVTQQGITGRRSSNGLLRNDL